MQDIIVRFCRLSSAAQPPQYMSAQAAGMDLSAALNDPVTLAPGQRALVPTGISIELPAGFEGQVRPRSGLAIKHGLTVLNAPGTIDADYRGEVRVALVNLGQEEATVTPGMRVAQLVVAPVVRAEVVEADRLSDTRRGDGGFGHTG